MTSAAITKTVAALARLLGISVVISLSAVGSGRAQPAEILAEGAQDYEWYCTACHGGDGAGSGPMAPILVVPPADLTAIARNNGGKFPFWRIYHIVAGDVDVRGHETFQMPRFLKRFRGEEGKPGYLPAQVRVLLLTHYLEALQAK